MEQEKEVVSTREKGHDAIDVGEAPTKRIMKEEIKKKQL